MNASIIVDNFFEDPDDIHNYAYQMPYRKDENGHWPGERSYELCRKNPDFGEYIMELLISHGRFPNTQKNKIKVDAYFQKIFPFSSDPCDIVNKGFIHHDYAEWEGLKNNGMCTHTVLIYLNHQGHLFEGTTIYKLKNKDEEVYYATDIKRPLYSSNKKDLTYEEKKIKHLNQFEEDYDCKNNFNRMFSFDSKQFHGVKSYYSVSKEARLTLVVFLGVL